MFERMEISETIYEVFLENSYLKTTIEDANRNGRRRQMRGVAPW